jgi:spore coat protein U-like protein
MRSQTVAGVVLAVVVATSPTAFAQTKTAQFAVRATVVADCKVTVTDLNASNHAPRAASNALIGIDLQCAKGAVATLSLDRGGKPDDRLRRDGLTNWPDGGQTVYTANDHVTGSQSVAVGSSADAVKITVSF